MSTLEVKHISNIPMNKQVRVKRKPIKCPNCGNKTVATIFWGMPPIHELQDDIDNGKIVLGDAV